MNECKFGQFYCTRAFELIKHIVLQQYYFDAVCSPFHQKTL